MSWLVVVAAACVVAGLVPALLGLVNLRLYRVPSAGRSEGRDGAPCGSDSTSAAESPMAPAPSASAPTVSVLIPARDEERAIAGALHSVLAQEGVELEVVVVDDASTDRTASVVQWIARSDPRVRLVPAPRLPHGWNGKQHACRTAAAAARHDVLVFLDADVRLTRTDALRRLALSLDELGCDLASGIPRQLTSSALQAAVLPLIHFLLLGFLPIAAARRLRQPSLAAGCGQLFVVRRTAYEKVGHEAVRASRHDGVTLPRAFRRAGLRTDLFDATPLAECRMYGSDAELWSGLLKNADEGLGSAGAILPWTLLLGLGQVAPVPLAVASALLWLAGAGAHASWALVLAVLGSALSVGTRLVQAARFRLPLSGALLHPIGVSALLAIQWHALALRLMHRPVAWKGRTDGHAT